MLPVMGAEFTCKQPLPHPPTRAPVVMDAVQTNPTDLHKWVKHSSVPFNRTKHDWCQINLKLHVSRLTYINHRFTDFISRSDFPLSLPALPRAVRPLQGRCKSSSYLILAFGGLTGSKKNWAQSGVWPRSRGLSSRDWFRLSCLLSHSKRLWRQLKLKLAQEVARLAQRLTEALHSPTDFVSVRFICIWKNIYGIAIGDKRHKLKVRKPQSMNDS